MKIAVTFSDGEIFQHFGHSEAFKIYEVEDNKVISACVIDTEGSGHGALAGLLAEEGVDMLICGGIGGGAIQALASAGIKVYPGVSGDADARVAEFLNGMLDYDPNAQCSHHHEGEDHNCGEHSCGSHTCGH